MGIEESFPLPEAARPGGACPTGPTTAAADGLGSLGPLPRTPSHQPIGNPVSNGHGRIPGMTAGISPVGCANVGMGVD